jgi:uncharacterized protein
MLDELQTQLTAAMKAKDEVRLSTIRMIKTALMKRKVDGGKPLDEAAEMQVLQTLKKQRLESIEMFRQGGREDLAAKEAAELAIIESLLPAAASEQEMDAAVEAALEETGATSAKQMGLAMKAAQARLAGKTVDGKILSGKVRARLG